MRAIDDVLVVGAGLAGMTLATALKRGGLRPEVIEIHPKFDVLGVGISIQGPALRVLKSIGLIDQCVQAGFGYSQVVNCDQNGKIEGIVDLPPSQRAAVSVMRRPHATGSSLDPLRGHVPGRRIGAFRPDSEIDQAVSGQLGCRVQRWNARHV